MATKAKKVVKKVAAKSVKKVEPVKRSPVLGKFVPTPAADLMPGGRLNQPKVAPVKATPLKKGQVSGMVVRAGKVDRMEGRPTKGAGEKIAKPAKEETNVRETLPSVAELKRLVIGVVDWNPKTNGNIGDDIDTAIQIHIAETLGALLTVLLAGSKGKK